MACKKSELVQAINTYTTARISSDPNLIQYGGNLLGQIIETLEFAPEEEKEEVAEEAAPELVTSDT